MKNLRRGLSLLAIALALGPTGCPSDPVCPSCGLKLSRSTSSATLTLKRSSRYDADTVVGTTVVVRDDAGHSETHQYTPSQIPLPPGQQSTLQDPELFAVGSAITVKAQVTMSFTKPDGTPFSVDSELAVTEE